MTQKFHWLAAFALLLAFGADVVRAQEEQEEVSPAPHGTSCCKGCCASCACSGKCCTRETPADYTQYVVTTKIVHASPDGDCDEIMSPKVTVVGGQTANVVAQEVQAAEGQHGGVGLKIQVTKQDKQVHLNLGVEESSVCYVAPAGQRSTMTMRVQMASNVTPGKMKRLVLTKNSNGSDAEWLEVVVTEVTPEEDEDASPLDYVGGVVDALMDTAADLAMSLFGDDEIEPIASPRPTAVAAAPLYLQTPPLYYGVPVEAPCPAVKQCVAVEAVKKSVKHVHIGALNGTKSVEYGDGDKGWKGTADTITLRDGQLILEGRVHMVSSDGDDEITAEKLSMKAADLEIQIGD